jgi:hypothetical protein
MRKKIQVLIFLGFTSQVFGQSQDMLLKKEQIKLDPVTYIDKGGVLTDDLLRLPDKGEAAIFTSDFIIHSNLKPDEHFNSEGLDDLNKMRNQASEDYNQMKKDWLNQNQSDYRAMTHSSEKRQGNQFINKK